MMHYEPAPKLKSLDDYIAVGFDADLCIIKYELRELTRICYESICKSLCDNFKYPPELFTFDPKVFYPHIQNNLILDLQTGNVLKVGKEKEVLRASHGLTMLTDDEIKGYYGPDRKFDFDINKSRNPPKYMICTTFFEAEVPFVYMQLVDLKDKDPKYASKTYNDLYTEIHKVLMDNFQHYSDKEYHNIREFGHYFPMTLAQSEKVFPKQTRMRKILEGLRAKGVLLFVNSNSHYEYLDYIFRCSFGEDWLNLFDAVVGWAKKPTFFMNKDKKFREVDEKQPNRLGKELTEPEPGKIVLEGTEELLYNYFKKIAKRDGRILYFGDNYITDCLACQANKQTDAVCIMEELDPSTKLCEDSLWGDYFKDTFDGKEVENYFVSLMKENVALIASSCYDPALIKFYGLDK